MFYYIFCLYIELLFLKRRDRLQPIFKKDDFTFYIDSEIHTNNNNKIIK